MYIVELETCVCCVQSVNDCMYIMQNCCYSKCGVVLEELNPHLPFGDHLLANFSLLNLIGTRGFYAFSIVCIVNEGV